MLSSCTTAHQLTVINVPVLDSLVNASLSLADNWSKMSALEQAKTVFTLVVQGGRQLNLLPPPAAHTAISAGSAVLVGADGAGQAPNDGLTLSYHWHRTPAPMPTSSRTYTWSSSGPASTD